MYLWCEVLLLLWMNDGSLHENVKEVWNFMLLDCHSHIGLCYVCFDQIFHGLGSMKVGMKERVLWLSYVCLNKEDLLVSMVGENPHMNKDGDLINGSARNSVLNDNYPLTHA